MITDTTRHCFVVGSHAPAALQSDTSAACRMHNSTPTASEYLPYACSVSSRSCLQIYSRAIFVASVVRHYSTSPSTLTLTAFCWVKCVRDVRVITPALME